MPDSPLLCVRELSKALSGREVLHGISLDLVRGEFVGLVGPNGAGKTTLLRCITGQWTVPEGAVTIDGMDVARNPIAVKHRFGYAPGDLLDNVTGRQHVMFVAALRKLSSPEAEISALADLVDLTPELDTEVGTYSFGMKQKLGIILALLGHPPLVVLDEALNGLDPIVGYRVKNYLRDLAAEGQTGILLASHMLESLEKYCTRIAMIRGGVIHRIWLRADLEAEAAAGKNLEELFVETMELPA
jgi:ABC-2 type transport system ATP-binding protein